MWAIKNREAGKYVVVKMDSYGYTVDRLTDTPEETWESKAAARDVMNDLGDYWTEQCVVARCLEEDV